MLQELVPFIACYVMKKLFAGSEEKRFQFSCEAPCRCSGAELAQQPVAERGQVQLHSAERENAPPREWSARRLAMKKVVHESLEKPVLRKPRQNKDHTIKN